MTPTQKPDTSKGFHPTLPSGADIQRPSVAVLRLDGALDRSVLSPQLHQVLLGVARVRNAVSSFRLEGERVELDRAREVLESRRPDSPAERGVLQLAQAYRDLSEGRGPTFSVAGLEATHRELFNGVSIGGSLGKLKVAPNVITDVTETRIKFHPTPPPRVRGELEALFEWLSVAENRALPPVVASIFFAEFEAIHPFTDGNGRLGRFLNVALLRKLGLRNSSLVPLDTRFFRTSDRYYEYLATTNAGTNYALWSRYYVHQLQKAYESAARRGDLKATLAKFSKASTQTVFQWVLMGEGDWFHRRDYPNPRGYSGAALWGSFQELVRAGVLEARGEAKGRQYRLSSKFLAHVYGRLA
jgi:Fic family protein